MSDTIARIFAASASLKSALASDALFLSQVEAAAEKMRAAVKSGGTIYACGNGGSASDAAHLCEELVARYKRERPGIRAMHFGDPGILTCWSNDYDFAGAYERQAQTFCTASDVLVAISTSGNSENILRAAKAAKERGTLVVALTGKGGGKLAPLADCAIVVPSQETERIQEVHITIVHIWCELLETSLSR